MTPADPGKGRGQAGTKGERWLLRAGEFLVGRAVQRLPRKARDERYREWTAELPVILHDPDAGRWPLRAGRMLGYALDTNRGTMVRPQPARHRGAHRRARLLATSAALLTAGPMLYFMVTASGGLGSWITSWLLGTAVVASETMTRHRQRFSSWVLSAPWIPMSLSVLATGQIALIAARDAHWGAGRLHVVTLASYGTSVACVICMAIGLGTWLWRHRQRRAQRT